MANKDNMVAPPVRRIQELSLVAFSQGTLLANAILPGLDFRRKVLNDNGEWVDRILNIGYVGAASGAGKFHQAAKSAGFTDASRRHFLINEIDDIGWGLSRTDPISDIIGGNFIYSENPARQLMNGLISIPGALSGNNSLHNKYRCATCRYNEMTPYNQGIWRLYPVSRNIDEEGNITRSDK